jgi:hypothetical protein
MQDVLRELTGSELDAVAGGFFNFGNTTVVADNGNLNGNANGNLDGNGVFNLASGNLNGNENGNDNGATQVIL